ncbi:MAG TPA: hypothetical protein VGN16_08800 [Acidobacteriaceae bacterium]|jgi:hypothetical protein
MTATKSSYEDKLALYEKVIAGIPGVERKGATNPYTSLNGHMFSRLDPSGQLSLRLPPEEREKFLKKYRTTLFESYGIVQKEYVLVPESLLKNTVQLQEYFNVSLRYIQTLKPKPSKKTSA